MAVRAALVAGTCMSAVLLSFAFASATYAATCNFAATTDNFFNTSANWSCGHVPVAADDAVIPAATSTDLDVASATVGNLFIGTGSTFDTSGNDLTINNTVSSTGSLVSSGSSLITIGNDMDFRGGGTFTPGTGTVIFSTPSIIDVSEILTNTPMSFNNLTVSSTQFVRPSSAVLYTVGGALTITQGTLHLVNGSSVTVNGAMNTAAAGTFATQSGTVFTANGTSTNNGIFGSLNAGLLIFNNDFINNGTILGTAPGDSESLTFNKAFTNTGTFNSGSSTVTFSGAGAQTIPSVTFWNLTGSKTSGVLSLGGNVVVNGTTSITDGGSSTFDYNGSQLEARGDTTMGVNFPLSGTLLIDGTGAQALDDVLAFHLIINKASGVATCFSGCEATSDFVIQSGTYNGGSVMTELLSTGGTPFLVAGGTFQPGTGTMRYAGSLETIATTTFNNLLIEGGGAHENMNGSTTVLGTFSMPLSNDSLAIGSSGILTVNGSFSNGGLITEGASGHIIHPAEAVTFTNSAGTPVGSYTSPTSVYFKVA
ncbi:MAG: hypothetical protein WA001_04170, partial [Patescibacteria group bacterium]